MQICLHKHWTVVVNSYVCYLLHPTARPEGAQQMSMALEQRSIQRSELDEMKGNVGCQWIFKIHF